MVSVGAFFKKYFISWAVMAHAFNLSTQEAEAGRPEFEAQLSLQREF